MRLRFDSRIILMIAVAYLIWAIGFGNIDMGVLLADFGGHSVKAVTTQTTFDPVPEPAEGWSGLAIIWWGFVAAASVAMIGGAIIVVGYALREFVVPSINDVRLAADPTYQAARTIRQSYKYGRKSGMTHAEQDGIAGVNVAKADVWRRKGDAVEASVEAARAKADLQYAKLDAVRQKLLPSTPTLPEPQPPAIYEKLDFFQAMSLSKGWSYRRAEIIFGQCHDGPDAGKLAKVDLTVNPFVMVSGKPNTGKTKGAAFTIAAAVAQWGWPMVVFEPGNKRDWKKVFGAHVLHHNLNVDNCMTHLEMMEAEYNRRADILRRAGFIEWNECDESARLCPPCLIIVEELGTTLKRIGMRSEVAEGVLESKQVANNRLGAFLAKLSIIVLEARAAGMLMLAIQQRPVDYPSDLLSSFTHIAYNLGGIGQGTIVNSPRNHLLAEQGQFDVGDVSRSRTINGSAAPIFYESFDAKHDIGHFLDGVPTTPKISALAPNGCCEAIAVPAGLRTQQRPQPSAPRPAPAEERRYIPAWEPPAPALPAKPQALADAETLYVAERKWDTFALAWCAAYPTRLALLQATGQPITPADSRTPPTPADLAKAMADLHNERFPADPKHWKQNFYSQARRLFARYHKAGVPEAVEGVVEQIIRDEAKEAEIKKAKRAGTEIVHFNRSELGKPKFLS